MNNEELDASIRSHLDRRDTYARPHTEDIKIVAQEDTVSGFYILMKYGLPLGIGMLILKTVFGHTLSIDATSQVITFFGVLGFGCVLWRLQREATAQHENDMIKSEERKMLQEEYKMKNKKVKKKILFGEEDQLE